MAPKKDFLVVFHLQFLILILINQNLILGYQKVQESRHKWKLQDFEAFNPDTDVNSDLDQMNQHETGTCV